MTKGSRRSGGTKGGGRGADRGALGGEQVEGRRAVLELLRVGRRPVRRLVVARDREPDGGVEEIVTLAGSAGVRIEAVTPAELRDLARTSAPQGVIARADPLPEADVSQMLARPEPFVVAIDGVTDPGNLGAVVRTAETAGATGVVLTRHRAVGLTPAAVKAAAGAIEHLPIALVAGIPAFLERAGRAGVWTVGLDERGTTSVHDLTVGDGPVVLVLGAEGRGLARLTRERCDVIASIPMRGVLPSLNVAAAAAVACFEIARRRAGAQGSVGAPPE